MHFLKKGQKIRAWVGPTPLIQAMPERKRFFSIDVFPNFHIQCEFYMLSLIAAFDWQIYERHIGEICSEWVQGQFIRLSGCLGPAEIMKDITDYNAAAQQQTKLNEKI